MDRANQRARMTPEQFASLRAVIARRAGILLPDNKRYMLESRLTPRVAELALDDFGQYVTLLTAGPYQAEEFQALYSLLRSGECPFFRNEAQLQVFERRVLPELLEQRESTRRVRIWAAACSTGEEAYTLAILLHRALGGRLADWHIEVFGTDLTPQLLEVARAGEYETKALGTMPEAVRSGFFAEVDGRWRIDEDIRRMVSFGALDLRDAHAASRHGLWDVIFCRDAMVNCDDATRRRIVETLSNALADDGTLFIGDAENIRDVTDALRPISVPQGYCYERSCRSAAGRTAPPVVGRVTPFHATEPPRGMREPGADPYAPDAWEPDFDERTHGEAHSDESPLTPVISSVHNVFSTLFQLPVSVGEPRKGSLEAAGRAVTGTVELSGQFTGSIAMHFPASTAESVVSLFSGHRLDPCSPDFADAIGELVGLVSGGARPGLGGRGVTISRPVVSTRPLETADAESVFIPCVTDRGSFSIEVAIRESSTELV